LFHDTVIDLTPPDGTPATGFSERTTSPDGIVVGPGVVVDVTTVVELVGVVVDGDPFPGVGPQATVATTTTDSRAPIAVR
jgi:hypothetical protein